ncbi:amidase family protein [Culicoidibacter larvae]|uniref:Uncharacterized protein n=1 Tax=Culicoidibacter larvae TaxID=2579976 RepID=A0A5R8QBG3_9FIRM|nr:amidase family protein [Culicoidibacter larvae]TLG72999.1 hypothetical protein FEZ08_08105 [Culicoidibacter larvae]
MNKLKYFAKATMAAMSDRYHSVVSVNQAAFDESCERIERHEFAAYMGVKNTDILRPCVEQLKTRGYLLHTVDAASDNGRAIDVERLNPLTGRHMSGSSSGTAINVFTGINDIGVGSDGGGSVLAPAISLNLFAFMSPLLPVVEAVKQSTDNLQFQPSAGIMARDWASLDAALDVFGFSGSQTSREIHIAIPADYDLVTENGLEVVAVLRQALGGIARVVLHEVDFIDAASERAPAIAFLEVAMTQYDMVAFIEGPIDVHSYGDSVMGSFSAATKANQQRSGKGFLRVANMAGGTAIAVPAADIATGITLYCRSEQEVITQMAGVAGAIPSEIPAVVQRYFHQNAQSRQQGYIK